MEVLPKEFVSSLLTIEMIESEFAQIKEELPMSKP